MRPLKQWIRRSLGYLPKSGAFWFVISALAMLGASGAFSAVFWDWLRPESQPAESNATTIRNIALVTGGAVALVFATWRSRVAERRADTAQQVLLNERYQKGAEMLGNGVLSVRLGGIYALQRLAEEHPEQYHIQVMRLFCAFARLPTKDQSLEAGQVVIKPGTLLGIRQDVEAVMDAIGSRGRSRIALEREADFRLDLRGTDLPGAQFLGFDLSKGYFHHSNLTSANFANTDLSDAFFTAADLSQARFYKMNFLRTRFGRANLSGAIFEDADLTNAGFHNVDLSGANLSGSNLSGATFQDAKVSNARLERANLSRAGFLRADLSGARLVRADLSSAHFLDADLNQANIADANLSGVEFSVGGPQTAEGLTQAQLDQARADPNNPPKLTGVLDAETGDQLVWRGKQLCEEA